MSHKAIFFTILISVPYWLLMLFGSSSHGPLTGLATMGAAIVLSALVLCLSLRVATATGE